MVDFFCPSKIITGDGCATALGAEAVSLGAGRVWLVTDKVLREKTECVAEALASLKAAGVPVEVFDDVEPDPLVTTAVRSTHLARSFAPDVIVGLGGGSALDIAKATATFLANDLPLEKMWGRGNVPKAGTPLILLPTTGGTGSEASTSCVLTDTQADGSHMKRSIVSQRVVPNTAIVDPLLTLTVPPAVTAATGMDALTHAVETYVSKEAQPLTDTLAMEAVRLIGKYLRRAVANGSDIEARRGMSNAALMAGLAFSNGQLGIVHAFAMVMGGQFNISHGVANALMLPYVMEFNEMAATRRFAQIAEALGERVEGLSERDAAHRATLAVRRLAEDVGIPRRLEEVKIPREAVPSLAAEVFKNQRLRGVNPRGTTVKDLAGILEHAAQGS
jgi:alcohol dehydrogenase class IV